MATKDWKKINSDTWKLKGKEVYVRISYDGDARRHDVCIDENGIFSAEEEISAETSRIKAIKCAKKYMEEY